jgi:hypothetical protein
VNADESQFRARCAAFEHLKRETSNLVIDVLFAEDQFRFDSVFAVAHFFLPGVSTQSLGLASGQPKRATRSCASRLSLQISKMKFTTSLVSLLCLVTFLPSAHGGARDLDKIVITNATSGEEPAISKRLYELLMKDIVFVLEQAEKYEFEWDSGVKLTSVDCPKGVFEPMIIAKNSKAIVAMIEKAKAWDGLIVYEYDAKGGSARLKLFDSEGREKLLIRLPLDRDGPMKGSILRGTRRAAIVAVGGAIDFNP